MAENESKDRIIQELITHINSLEQKISMLKDELSEENDLQTVNRLDIINLKNEIDRIKISVPIVSPEMAGKMKDLEILVSGQDRGGALNKMLSDIEQLKKTAAAINPDTLEEIQGEISALYDIVNRNQKVEPGNQKAAAAEGRTASAAMERASSASKDVADLKKRIQEMETKSLKIPHCRKCGAACKPGAKFCGSCGKGQ
jgi:ribosomal protein L40E